MAHMSGWHRVCFRPHQGRANEFCIYFPCHLLKVKSSQHLPLLHEALMAFVKHLSASVCLFEGPNGNHQPRGARLRRSDRWKRPGLTRLRTFSAFSDGSACVLVKQALGAGLWLPGRGACLPTVVCKLLFRCGRCCDNKLWPRSDPGLFSSEDQLRF